MKRKNYIFLPTVNHTGTWFVGAILHAGFGYFFRCYHTELEPEDSGIEIKPFLTVKEHIVDMSIQEIQEVYDLLNKGNGCLMVVPVRDILAAIISAKRRNPPFLVNYVIDALVLVIQEFERFNPFYFPIDLYADPKDREDLLTALEGRIGKEMGLVDDMDKREVAESWLPRNEATAFCLKLFDKPNLELKVAYEQKNLACIIPALSEEWDYLMEKREVIQPFFEKFGYRNLLWFEESAG